MAPRPLRAGDSDRAAVVALLRAHHLEGRLTVDEFEERVGQAHRAVTLIELGDLHSDLPERPERRTGAVARSGAGYELSVIGGALMFRRRWRPGWTILLAVFTFPIGLLALTHQNTDEVIVDIGPGPRGGTELIAHGVGPLAVRRAFSTLRG